MFKNSYNNNTNDFIFILMLGRTKTKTKSPEFIDIYPEVWLIWKKKIFSMSYISLFVFYKEPVSSHFIS